MRETFALRDATVGREHTFVDLLAMAHGSGAAPGSPTADTQLATLLDALVTRTGWDRAAVETLIAPDAFNLVYPTDWTDEKGLTRLRDALGVLVQTGARAEDRAAWATESPAKTEADMVLGALRAKTSETSWAGVIRPIRDTLREKKRDALLGYVLAERGLESADELFGQLLIDVQMSACQPSSRVQQAIGSVQSFVQRALLALEPAVQLSPEDAVEWDWMKNYRVWEANRKVFLYPENWIEPALRDDKTPLFRALETKLQQNEITPENVETAFGEYLEGLVEVAQLEMCATCYVTAAESNEGVDVLYVVGRTPALPRRYFLRQHTAEAGWTPWEKIEIEIEGDHLVAAFFSRRLHLFWPSIRVQAVPVKSIQREKERPPQMRYELQMSYSQLRAGHWTAKRTCTDTVMIEQRPNGSGEEIFFRTAVQPDCSLSVSVLACWDAENKGDFYEYGAFVLDLDGTMSGNNLGTSVQYSNAYLMPAGTVVDGMRFRQVETQVGLTLPFHIRQFGIGMGHILNAAPDHAGQFHVLPVAQERHMPDDMPFFYQDSLHTFAVFPSDAYRKSAVELRDENPRLELIDRLMHSVILPIVPHDANAPLFGAGRPIYDTRALQVGPSAFKMLADQVQTDEFSGPRTAMDNDIGGGRFLPRMVQSGDNPTVLGVIGGVHTDLRTIEAHIVGLDAGASIGSVLGNTVLRNAVPFPTPEKTFRFEAVHHPFARNFLRALNHHGVDGLLGVSTKSQQLRTDTADREYFLGYDAQDVVETTAPNDTVDFASSHAFADYNWEVFFHAPLLLADRLRNEQRFAEAIRWYHFIFNPTVAASADNSPARFWGLKPFIQEASGLAPAFQMETLGYVGDDLAKIKARDEIERQIADWRVHPFSPHRIARLRLSAYQKNVVMRYLDTLIAWGDQLYTRDSLESINEATQLYILAALLLGPRPQELPELDVQVASFNDLADRLDDFSNALVTMESALPIRADDTTAPSTPGETQPVLGPSAFLGGTPYFCIPANDQLLAYWDKVADRLFKIRHCMNIDGAVQTLPLFEPPIDPALLVRAAAAGVDIHSAVTNRGTALPNYRFLVMHQKAMELAGDVQGLGSALLSAYERRDAEALAQIRSGQELTVANAVRAVREQQVRDAEANLAALHRAQEIALHKKGYYGTRVLSNEWETANLSGLEAAHGLQLESQVLTALAGVMALFPELDAGVSGIASPVFKARLGGSNISSGLQAEAGVINILAGIETHKATVASILGGQHRRMDDWVFMAEAADRESKQIEKQILAAEIRVEIAQHELANHDIQIANLTRVDEFMRSKFTNQELFDWMVAQVSSLYFQSYQLAFDLARRAERAYALELGYETQSPVEFIHFGHWDSLRKGLLAGERLRLELRQMEVAFLENNRREFEITRQISLAALDPVALVKLRETGECFVSIPEALFDLDHPGHYMRRIRSVAVTVPCVTGPYTSVGCELTLTNASTRFSKDLADGYMRKPGSDNRFRDATELATSIVTSSGQGDMGMFEANLRDERFLPFEGLGAISDWNIRLPGAVRQFDYNTISDVVLTLRYTARTGGEDMREAAETGLRTALDAVAQHLAQDDVATTTGLVRVFSARQEFPTQWYQFLHPAGTDADQTLTLPLTETRFPYVARGQSIQIHQVRLFARVKDRGGYVASPHVPLAPVVLVGAHTYPATGALSLVSDAASFGSLPQCAFSVTDEPPGDWSIKLSSTNIESTSLKLTGSSPARVDPAALDDLILAVYYTASS